MILLTNLEAEKINHSLGNVAITIIFTFVIFVILACYGSEKITKE